MSMSWLSKPVLCLALLLGVCAMSWGPQVAAQDESEFEDDDDSDADVSVIRLQDEPLEEVEQDNSSTQLGAIQVTARKKVETIQDVPLSVTAFNAEDMERRGFTGIEDIAAATPGFTYEPFATGGAHGNAVIRGLAQQFTTSRIQNVSFFLDGVYLQRQSMLDLGLIDMERIEVIKGPQNALYGRNAFAGAVNYVTERAGALPGGYLSFGVGDNQRRDYRMSLNGPMNEFGTLAGKVTIGLGEYDGHTRNDHPFANADAPGPNQMGNLGGFDNESYSAALAFEPNNDLLMRASYYRNQGIKESSASYSISGVNVTRFGLRFDDQIDLNCNEATVQDIGNPSVSHTGNSAWCGELPRYASDVAPRTVDGIVIDPRAIGTIATTDAVTFSTFYQISDFWAANYLFGFADHTSYTDGGASDDDRLDRRGILTNFTIAAIDGQNPNAYEFANTSSSRPNTELKATSHEMRFDWTPEGPLSVSFGLYQSTTNDEEWTELFIMDLCNGDTQENIDNCSQAISAPNTLAERTELTIGVAYDQHVRQHGGQVRGEFTAFEDSINAVFASATYNFTDDLEGTLEGRYSVEEKIVDRFTDSFALAPGETVTYSQPEDPVVPGLADSITSAIVVPHDEETYRYFTPRGILNWNFTKGGILYGSAAKGVKSGGFNNADDPTELTYDEAENWTYEIGTKNSFWGGAAVFNAAVFYVDWTGLQGGVPPTVGGLSTSDIITNIGGASSLGAELETRIYTPWGFVVNASGTYNDATYDDGVIYAAGDQEDGSFHCDGVTCPADGAIGGNQLARSSKLQGSFGIAYNQMFMGWGVSPRIDVNYQSKQFITPLNLAWVPARTLVNASLHAGSPTDAWNLNFWVKNLTDEDYAANSFYIGVFNQYLVGKGPRRTFGASLKYNF